MKIIARGAEAVLLKNKGFLIKKRVKKGYRHPLLDQTIRKRRTKREARILKKVFDFVSVPKIKKVEKYTIEMSFLNGKLLSNDLNSLNTKKQAEIAKKLGGEVGKLHKMDIIHGDLTTSNMIFKDKIFLFDFGLSFHSTKVEDRAVDIHLLKEALNSKHFKISEKFFKEFAKSYSKKYQKGREVLSRLEEVEKRGRYKRKGML